jgi:SAM-dependent methyltransferase
MRKHHHHDIDWADFAEALELQGETFSPYLDAAFDRLADLTPERVLDIGSGPGLASCRLARRFEAAEVVAVDGSPELLAHAADRARRLGVRLRTLRADFPADLADLPEADLIWSSHVIHHVGDQLAALSSLAGRLRPGGVIAIAEGGLPTRWLPRDIGFGRPGLAERLDAAKTTEFSGMRAALPDSVSVAEDWPSLLRTAGFVDAHSASFLIDHPAPLADQPRRFVRHYLERFRNDLADTLDPDDLTTLDRLLEPDNPAGIDHRRDVFVLSAQTVHFARKPE